MSCCYVLYSLLLKWLCCTPSTVLSLPTSFALWIHLGTSPNNVLVLISAENKYRGFAIGWDYAITWLTILPFELTAAALTIKFWRDDINVGVWITVFLVVLASIQVFGVRGYGEGNSLFLIIGGFFFTYEG